MIFVKVFLGISTFVLAVYGLIKNNYGFHFLMIFLLGLTVLVMGIEEQRREIKLLALCLLGVAVFSFSTSFFY